MNCPLPQGKTGKHVIYNVWQRSDSPEAFYACIDVSFSGAVANLASAGQPARAAGPASRCYRHPASVRCPGPRRPASQPDPGPGRQRCQAMAAGAGAEGQPGLHLVNIGVLDAYGAVSPVASSQDNQDLRAPGRLPLPGRHRTAGRGRRRATGRRRQVDFDYPQGLQQYDAGTVVRGADGKRYQCKPYPNSGWCRAGTSTTPGQGMAWQDAWTLL